MTKEEFKKFLQENDASIVTTEFAVSCFESGRNSMREQLADELQKMPLNDTANSIAIWIRGQE